MWVKAQLSASITDLCDGVYWTRHAAHLHKSFDFRSHFCPYLSTYIFCHHGILSPHSWLTSFLPFILSHCPFTWQFFVQTNTSILVFSLPYDLRTTHTCTFIFSIPFDIQTYERMNLCDALTPKRYSEGYLIIKEVRTCYAYKIQQFCL